MKLYKYVSPDRIDVITNLELRFTQPGALNDPFELRPQFQSLISEAELLSRLAQAPIDLAPRLRETYDMLPDAERAQIPFETAATLINTFFSTQKMRAMVSATAVSLFREMAPELTQRFQEQLYAALDANVGILSLSEVPAGSLAAADVDLRKALLSFIANFANWDNSAKPVYLECARGLVRAAHGKEPPLVVDPFAGGGSIPLEALRVGCEAFASDSNPLACLILKVLLEDIPRHGSALAEELRRVGRSRRRPRRSWRSFIPLIPMGQGRSPISGHVRCAAKRWDAARKFPS